TVNFLINSNMAKPNGHGREPACTDRNDTLQPSPEAKADARQKNGTSHSRRYKNTVGVVHHCVNHTNPTTKFQRSNPSREGEFNRNADKNNGGQDARYGSEERPLR